MIFFIVSAVCSKVLLYIFYADIGKRDIIKLIHVSRIE